MTKCAEHRQCSTSSLNLLANLQIADRPYYISPQKMWWATKQAGLAGDATGARFSKHYHPRECDALQFVAQNALGSEFFGCRISDESGNVYSTPNGTCKTQHLHARVRQFGAAGGLDLSGSDQNLGLSTLSPLQITLPSVNYQVVHVPAPASPSENSCRQCLVLRISDSRVCT